MAFSSLVMMVVMMVLPLLVLGTPTVMNPVVPREGEEYLLKCEGEGEMAFFLLHQEGSALEVGVHEELKLEVFENATVYFESVSLTHEGTHLCLRTNEGGNIQGFPAPLRVRPLPPMDLWGEVYEAKFVTGFVAALVVAAVFALGCLVYKYRWQPLPEKDGLPILPSSFGYDNPGMSRADDGESNCSTKM